VADTPPGFEPDARRLPVDGGRNVVYRPAPMLASALKRLAIVPALAGYAWSETDAPTGMPENPIHSGG
jgi:hypothetical protein